MDFAAHIPLKVEDGSYLRDTPNDEVSHFRVVPRPDSANADEFVDPFDSPSHGRYHGIMIDESPVATTLGSNFSTASVAEAYRVERTACRHEMR